MLSACFKDDSVVEIGIDEAGRGSFWGPIMAGAVIIPEESTAKSIFLIDILYTGRVTKMKLLNLSIGIYTLYININDRRRYQSNI